VIVWDFKESNKGPFCDFLKMKLNRHETHKGFDAFQRRGFIFFSFIFLILLFVSFILFLFLKDDEEARDKEVT